MQISLLILILLENVGNGEMPSLDNTVNETQNMTLFVSTKDIKSSLFKYLN